jgi:hypothetical protein
VATSETVVTIPKIEVDPAVAEAKARRDKLAEEEKTLTIQLTQLYERDKNAEAIGALSKRLNTIRQDLSASAMPYRELRARAKLKAAENITNQASYRALLFSVADGECERLESAAQLLLLTKIADLHGVSLLPLPNALRTEIYELCEWLTTCKKRGLIDASKLPLVFRDLIGN